MGLLGQRLKRLGFQRGDAYSYTCPPHLSAAHRIMLQCRPVLGNSFLVLNFVLLSSSFETVDRKEGATGSIGWRLIQVKMWAFPIHSRMFSFCTKSFARSMVWKITYPYVDSAFCLFHSWQVIHLLWVSFAHLWNGTHNSHLAQGRKNEHL